MDNFGIRFRIDRPDLYAALEDAFADLKRAKDEEAFGNAGDWKQKLHPEVAPRLFALSDEERVMDHHLRSVRPVVITSPQEAIGSCWDFGAILDAVEMGDYQLLESKRIDDHTVELRIDPHGYPYGGLGAFIALAEAHGMHVLGVNECGEYESRTALTGQHRGRARKWWQFWR